MSALHVVSLHLKEAHLDHPRNPTSNRSLIPDGERLMSYTDTTITELQREKAVLEARIQELLEANTRLVEERRAIDRNAMVAQFHRVVANAPVNHVPAVPSDDRVRL